MSTGLAESRHRIETNDRFPSHPNACLFTIFNV